MFKTKNFALQLVFIVLMAGMVSCSGEATKNEDITIITADNFTSVTHSGIVLIDFWADWCMPCKAMAPVVNKIAYQTRGKVTVAKIDIDAEPALANQFGVTAIPTLVILKDGEEVERLIGLKTNMALEDALSKYVKLK